MTFGEQCDVRNQLELLVWFTNHSQPVFVGKERKLNILADLSALQTKGLIGECSVKGSGWWKVTAKGQEVLGIIYRIVYLTG